MRYLILQIFQTNDWEGAYSGTKIKRIECTPNQLDRRIKKLKLTKRIDDDDYIWEVCSEILVFDENLELVRRKEIDVVKFRRELTKQIIRRAKKWLKENPEEMKCR